MSYMSHWHMGQMGHIYLVHAINRTPRSRRRLANYPIISLLFLM